MNIRDLKYLVALMDHRHFGNAFEHDAAFHASPLPCRQAPITRLNRTNAKRTLAFTMRRNFAL
ncbi:MAG: hypothetical protein EBY09_09435 [Verrucomicrobia bacterium]|nr:hypothetical protein [Verrucomicrobiota bacterium]